MFHRASDNNGEPNLLLCCNFLPLEHRIGHSDLARVKKNCLIKTKFKFNKEPEDYGYILASYNFFILLYFDNTYLCLFQCYNNQKSE